jgi:hypothetical protein
MDGSTIYALIAALPARLFYVSLLATYSDIPFGT